MKKGKYTKKRILYCVVGIIWLSIGFFFLFKTFNKNLVFFYSPTEYFNTIEQNADFFEKRKFRIGGIIKHGSLTKEANSLKVSFYVTDLSKAIKVSYEGMLPPMFREGQGIVAEGKFAENNLFMAKKLITKHDEKYTPPELKRTLETQENGKY